MKHRAGLTDEEIVRSQAALLSRRAVLARATAAVVGASSIGALLAACGGSSSPDSEGAPPETGSTGASGEAGGGTASGTVKYLGWQGYDDPGALKPLTDGGATVQAEYITTNDDIVTKLRGGGKGTIDVVSPFVGYIPALVAADLIEILDYERLPATQSFYPEFTDLALDFGSGERYCAPLVWGDTPMIIRPDQFTDPPESWLDLKDPKYKGQLLTLDDTYGNVVIYGRALFGPEQANKLTPDMLEDVKNIWIEIKKNLVSIVPSFGDAADIMGRGDASALIQGWRFVEVQLKSEGVEAAAHMPKEGSYSWTDTLAIAKDAPNQEGAYAFIDAAISPEGDALIGAATGSGVTNMGAVANLPADQQSLYPYDQIEEFLTVTTSFYALPLEPEGDFTTYDDWLKAWEEVKAA